MAEGAERGSVSRNGTRGKEHVIFLVHKRFCQRCRCGSQSRAPVAVSRCTRLREAADRLIARPMDLAALGAFRFLFGLVMAAAMARFLAKGWVRQLYVEPAFYFHYPGLAWVRPWPEPFMHVHFVLLAVLAVGVALGFFYRTCCALFSRLHLRGTHRPDGVFEPLLFDR